MIEKGFFCQDDVHKILKFKTLNEAKQYAGNSIDQFVSSHPLTRGVNIEKARKIVAKARSQTELAFSVQNFIMAHPSEGLSVIR